jgi:periplasmic divalent cation tolerance protein
VARVASLAGNKPFPTGVIYNQSPEAYFMPSASQFRIVLVTCASLSEARKIARAVIQKRFAACVNVSSSTVESFYPWKGKLEKSREYLLLIKTSAKRVKALEKEVLCRHSYETPEFLVLPISSGSPSYLSWLARCLSANGK